VGERPWLRATLASRVHVAVAVNQMAVRTTQAFFALAGDHLLHTSANENKKEVKFERCGLVL
jgi:hypothetical protein